MVRLRGGWAAAAAVVALGGLPDAAIACDTALLELSAKNFAAGKDPELRLKKLAGSLAESCKFVPAVRDALGTVPSVTPAGRLGLERKAIAADATAWTAACPGGAAAFEAAAGVTGAERAAAMWTACDVQRFGFTDEASLSRATGLPFLTLLVAQHFSVHGVADPLGDTLLRALAGIEAPAPAAPVDPAADPWGAARQQVEAVRGKAFDQSTAAEWRAAADRLLPLCETVRHRADAERKANRQLEYDVCAYAGFAADNSGSNELPLFRPVAGNPVNWGYYLAGATARTDATLVTRTGDETMRNAIGWYLDQLRSNTLPPPP